MSRYVAAMSLALFVGAALGLAAAQEPGAPARTQAKDLVSVHVAGTGIDFVPEYVDVVTASPQERIAELVAAGGQRPEGGIPNAVSFRRILYIFATPEQWRESTGHEFADGDVIYTYVVGSREERDEFVRGYALSQVADVAGKERPHPLYTAAPGYYVLALVPVTSFTCTMHPQIRARDEGRCPICGMELVPVETFE